MSRPTLPPDIEWKKQKSALGNDYEVGFVPGDEPEPEDPPRLPAFAVRVNWPVGRNVWRPTPQEVQSRAAITRYSLYDQAGSTYRYILKFTNTAHYKYYFEDQTGDRYLNNTFRNGDHYIRYNSDRPTIILIDGS